ncbi:MAG: hypothetical protein CYG59_01460 [Chloroflexi bacterium]|nr:MAG: hypothetical protein CYG59_01460 [Chloroflexota bacterium]
MALRKYRLIIASGLLLLLGIELWYVTRPRMIATGDVVSIPAELQGRLAIFILAGQSNMAARGLPTYSAPPDPHIFVYGEDRQWRYAAARRGQQVFVEPDVGAGPGLAFAQALRADDPSMTIGLIQCAQMVPV